MKKSNLQPWLLALLLLSASMSFGQGDVQNLVGAKGAGAETELHSKGYTHIKTDKSAQNIYSYWWNQRSKTCICERLNNGRVVSIVKTLPFDCNKSNEGSANHYNNYSHSSAHHSNGMHDQDANIEMAYERGFRDGKMNNTYHNVYTGNRMIQSYASGYTSGVQERTRSSRYHHGGGGYHSGGYVEVHDLEGRDGEYVVRELKNNRGFREIHSFQHDGNHRKIMHNNNTGQCIEVVFHGDRIHEIKHYKDCNKYL